MRQSWRALLLKPYSIFVAGLVLYLAFLLVGPRTPHEVQRDYCVANINVANTVLGLSLNCDSLLYIESSEHPQALLAENSLIQTRPGIIMLNYVLKQPFRLLNSVPKWLDVQSQNNWIDPNRVNQALDHGFPEYITFILINFALINSAFFALRSVSGSITSHQADLGTSAALGSLAIILLTNDVTKAFFWSPHTQMFNIAVPLLSVFFGVWAYRGGLFRLRQAIVACAFIGWSILSYGAGVMMLATVGAGVLFRLLSNRDQWLNLMARYAVFSVVAVLPLLAWLTFVRMHNGTVYSVEVERYGQFVWMNEALKQGIGHLIAVWLGKFFLVVRLGIVQAWPVLILALIAAAGSGNLATVAQSFAQRRLLILMCLLTSVLAACLYATIGFVQTRLAFSIVPPIMLACAAVLLDIQKSSPEPRRTAMNTSVFCFTIGLVIWTAIKDGPYS